MVAVTSYHMLLDLLPHHEKSGRQLLLLRTCLEEDGSCAGPTLPGRGSFDQQCIAAAVLPNAARQGLI